jgi:hypothetical protein
MIASLRGEVPVSVTADDCRVENNEWLGRSDYFLFLVVVGIVAAGAQDPDRHPHLRECGNQESHVSRGWVGSFLVRQRTTIVVPLANTLPAPGNPSIENRCRLQPVRRTVTFGQQSSQFMPAGTVPCSGGIARDRLRCRLFQSGAGAFCQCVGFVRIDSGAVGSLLQP